MLSPSRQLTLWFGDRYIKWLHITWLAVFNSYSRSSSRTCKALLQFLFFWSFLFSFFCGFLWKARVCGKQWVAFINVLLWIASLWCCWQLGYTISLLWDSNTKPTRATVMEMADLHLLYFGITFARVPMPLWKSSRQAQLTMAGRFCGRLKSVQ